MIVCVPVPAFVNTCATVALVPIMLPAMTASPRAVRVKVVAAVPDSLQILPVIVVKPLALKVSVSLLVPLAVPETEAMLKP